MTPQTRFRRVDLSSLEVPRTRQERIEAIFATIEKGDRDRGGYPLQPLISTVVVKWGLTRETVTSYFKDLERAGYTYIDNTLRVRVNRDKLEEVDSCLRLSV